jgi:hypothetical protein
MAANSPVKEISDRPSGQFRRYRSGDITPQVYDNYWNKLDGAVKKFAFLPA